MSKRRVAIGELGGTGPSLLFATSVTVLGALALFAIANTEVTLFEGADGARASAVAEAEPAASAAPAELGVQMPEALPLGASVPFRVDLLPRSAAQVPGDTLLLVEVETGLPPAARGWIGVEPAAWTARADELGIQPGWLTARGAAPCDTVPGDLRIRVRGAFGDLAPIETLVALPVVDCDAVPVAAPDSVHRLDASCEDREMDRPLATRAVVPAACSRPRTTPPSRPQVASPEPPPAAAEGPGEG